MPDRIPCRCLLHDAYPDMETLIRSVLDSMPEDNLCLHCSHLVDGTCLLCGCYVEARAASRFSRCPDTPPKWSSQS